MPRYKLTIEYCGTGYVGWQRQDGQPSIQQSIETAIAGFCGETLLIQGAGRTDAGVHALGQVAHADLSKDWPAERVQGALNAHLRPQKIVVTDVKIVPESFEARFSAVKRHYRYRIVNRRAPLTLDRNLALHVSHPLDADAMHAAAQVLVGKHDFSTFRFIHCQAPSPVKTVDHLRVSRFGEEIEITCSARSFLHNQVRSFVGALKWVGEGRWSAVDLRHALEARDRRRCAPVAAACGLYLTKVDYPE